MTSIEWLIEKLDKLDTELLINKLENKFSPRFYELTKNQIIEQAKEMHKKEIINAHLDGQSLVSCKDEYAEQYYQEKLKKD